MGGIVVQKKSLFIVIFLLVFLPFLLYIVGQRIRLQPKAGGGTDPRAMQPTTLVFPVYWGGLHDILNGSETEWYPDWVMQDGSEVVLQNISSETANVNAKTYGLTGTVVCSKSLTIPPFGQKDLDFRKEPCWSEIMSGYSVLVVNSDKGLRGVLNAVKTGTDSYMVDSYEGYLGMQKSNKWYFPSYLEGKGRSQDDTLRSRLFIFNPDPQKSVTVKTSYFKENGEYDGGSGPNILGALSSTYDYHKSDGYGTIVVEADGEVFSEVMTVSSKRMSFVKGQTKSKNEWLVNDPFEKSVNCPAVYEDSHPYCGEAKVLVYNASEDFANVGVFGLSKDGDMNLNTIVSPNLSLPANATGVFNLKDFKLFKVFANDKAVVANVLYQNDQYWDSSYMVNEPLTTQFLPFWAYQKLPFNTSAVIKLFNPNDFDVDARVEFYDNLGQYTHTLELLIKPFESSNYFWGGGYASKPGFGSARVSGYKIGLKGPSGEVPIFATVVGSQEIKGSRGLLAGDGAFIYQGVGYGNNTPISTPRPWVVIAGWNRVTDRSLSYDPYACLGTSRVDNYWVPSLNNLTGVYPPISPPEEVAPEKMPRRFTTSEYMRCGAIFRPQYPPSIPYPMPSSINYPYPVSVPPSDQAPINQPPVYTQPIPTRLGGGNNVNPPQNAY